MRDERRLDAVEKVIPLADEAGLPMTHLAMAFAITHPSVTSAPVSTVSPPSALARRVGNAERIVWPSRPRTRIRYSCG